MNKIRMGVVSLGVGSYHLDALNGIRDVEVTALCDINEELLKQKAAEYHVPFICTDYREMLGRDDIDAVTVTSPDQLHREMVVAFLEAGKHVLCEKPFALHKEDCEAMIEAGDKSGKILMVGQVVRMSQCAFVKEIIDKGVIGDVFYLESEYAHDYTLGHASDWRKDFKNPRHPVTGGGCHAVDLLRWFAGNPTEVFAYTNKKILTDWPLDDSAICVLKFPNNVIGKVFVSTGCKRRYTMRTLVYGSKGTVIADTMDTCVSLYLAEFNGVTKFLDRNMQNIEMRLLCPPQDHNFKGELEKFVSVIKGESENTLPGREGAATVCVCEAIIKSAETGKAEKVSYLD